MFFPKRLLFAGGGTRVLVFLSALKRLENSGYLKEVKEWWGTSAGALLATLLAIVQSVDTISEAMKSIDYTKFRDMNLLNLVQLPISWGLDDGHSLTKEVELLLESVKSGASKLTMADIPGLNIVVADLNIHETVVCSAATFPTLRVVDAIRASMSLPFFYRPFRCPVNGHIWVDGGLRAHFPWVCLKSDEERREALGFNFEKTWADGPAAFSEYMFSMLHFDEPSKIRHWKEKWKQNILWFPSPPFPAWYVRLQEDDFTILKNMGIHAVESWFSLLHLTPTEETSQSRPGCDRHCTPSPAFPQHRTDGMLGIHECPCPLQQSCPQGSRGSQAEIRKPSRRWSL
jgi:predicted acylesterase/phospholipase RssA